MTLPANGVSHDAPIPNRRMPIACGARRCSSGWRARNRIVDGQRGRTPSTTYGAIKESVVRNPPSPSPLRMSSAG